MKQFRILLVVLLISSSVFAQQTPDMFFKILDKCQNDLQKYDSGDDSIFNTLNQQIVITEAALTATNLPLEQYTQYQINAALWHFFMAQFLSHCSHFSSNLHSENFAITDSYKTWDETTFNNEIDKHLTLALKPDTLLQNTNLAIWSKLFVVDNPNNYTPTLYDFIIQEEINYYENRIPNSLFYNHQFSPELIAQLYSDNTTFAKLNFSVDDLTLPFYKYIILYQRATRFHLHSSYHKALIDITLKRLSILNIHTNDESNNSLYYQSLIQLEQQFRGLSGYEDVCYAIGKFFTSINNLSDIDYKLFDCNEFDVLKRAELWYQKAIDFAPKSLGANNSRFEIIQLKSKELFVSFPSTIIPNQPSPIQCTYKNCKELFFRIIKIDRDSAFIRRKIDSTEQLRYFINYPKTADFFITTEQGNDYKTHFTTAITPALPLGNYLLLASSAPLDSINFDSNKLIITQFEVTNLSCSYRKNYYHEFIITNSKTGEPVPKATLHINFFDRNFPYKKNITHSYKLITNKNGRADLELPADQKETYYNEVIIQKGEDISYQKIYIQNNDWNRYIHKSWNYFLFTDRKIYRPGQTIYYKIVLTDEIDNKSEIIPNNKFIISLLDINYQQIATDTLTSNEYGSASGSFILPTHGSTGSYRIVIQGRTCKNDNFINVEEYKRPTYSVTINEPDSSYKLNEEVTVLGNVKSFAGYAVEGATVKYTIKRSYSFPYWRWWHGNSPTANTTTILTGTTTSDKEGKFTLQFMAQSPYNLVDKSPLYNFSIHVEVTDINGETQQGDQNLFICDRALMLNLDLPNEISLDQQEKSFKLTANTLSNKTYPTTIHYEVILLETPKNYLSTISDIIRPLNNSRIAEFKAAFPYHDFDSISFKPLWKEIKTILKGTIQSSDSSQLVLSEMINWEEGNYKIKLSANDKYNNVITDEHYFYAYRKESQKCYAYQPIWLSADKTEAKVGDTVCISIGSYLKEAHLYLEIFTEDSMFISNWIKLNHQKRHFEIPILEQYRDKITVFAYMVQNGNQHLETLNITIPFTNKQLDIELITFRNKLLPGASEEWKIAIKGKEGNLIMSELLCNMYDASLDKFIANKYRFPLNYRPTSTYTYHSPFYFSEPSSTSYYMHEPREKDNKVLYQRKKYPKQYFTFFERLMYKTIFFADYSANTINTGYGDIEMTEGKNSSSISLARSADSDQLVHTDKEQIEPQIVDNITITPNTTRKNFNETAFFYPHLETDKLGNITFSFTMPDALTQWKFMGLAHSKDLSIGTFEQLIETGKELMVVPNMPRFFREGDTVNISAKVVNQSSKAITGEVVLQLFDANTNSKLNILADTTPQLFSNEPKTSSTVQFKIMIPKGTDALLYRIIASEKRESAAIDEQHQISLSDGEEDIIPIITNRQFITEAHPFFINGSKTEQTIPLFPNNTKSSSLEPFSLTLEYSPNPEWMVLLALPYLMEYPYECNEQIFSRYFAYTLALNIIRQRPDIPIILSDWKQKLPESLKSTLTHNQNLKSTLLEESPWLLDAQNENEQHENLIQLFDTVQLKQQQISTLKIVSQNQNKDGGWAWFSGGYSNSHITLHILSCIAQLNNLHINNNQIDIEMTSKAIGFIDGETEKEYLLLKKNNTLKNSKEELVPSIIYYLYVRSSFLNLDSNTNEAFNYYKTLLLKECNSISSLYLKTMAALTLNQIGEFECFHHPENAHNLYLSKSSDLMNNIKNLAQEKEGYGMWWKKEGYGCYWHEFTLERQCLLIDAFERILNDSKSVEQMKLWLIRQKQTQSWRTTTATVKACYALLADPNKAQKTITNNEASPITFIIGSDTMKVQDIIQPPVKQSLNISNATQLPPTTLQVNRSETSANNTTSFGAVYWQYFQDYKDITNSESTNLTVNKKVFKVVNNQGTETLEAIDSTHQLSVGDKVCIRLIITADRDYDFVHLKDLRASAFEPIEVFSRYTYQNRLSYYYSTRDVSTNYFIDHLPKGTYVLEYFLYTQQSGTFSNGLTTIQCMYAPEFVSHTKGSPTQLFINQ